MILTALTAVAFFLGGYVVGREHARGQSPPVVASKVADAVHIAHWLHSLT